MRRVWGFGEGGTKANGSSHNLGTTRPALLGRFAFRVETDAFKQIELGMSPISGRQGLLGPGLLSARTRDALQSEYSSLEETG